MLELARGGPTAPLLFGPSMYATPQQMRDREQMEISLLYDVEEGATLWPVIYRFLRLLRLACWRAFEHDAFAVAKASAYSLILTFFPALLVVGLGAGHLTPDRGLFARDLRRGRQDPAGGKQ